jgi:NAD(P)H-dependent FMN reductase
MTNVNLIGIIGSLRAGSANGALARAATGILPEQVALSLYDVSRLPLYNGDEETAGPPADVIALHAAVRDADGIVLFSPEYNSSLPAVTKNVIDWLSRDSQVWDGTGITMITMSPGGRAGLSAREHFSAIMQRQATRLFETIGFGTYGDRLDADENVTDPATLAELADFLTRYADHCRG